MIDLNNSSLSQICKYLVETHHVFTRSSIEEIMSYMEKQNLEIPSLKQVFFNFGQEMFQHLQKEENILFPYIQKLDTEKEPEVPFFGTIQNPIRMMSMEHNKAEEDLKEFRRLCADFRVTADTGSEIQYLYTKLQELEKDLEVHMQIENEILFPRSIERENEL